jgi:uncharacterized protein YkwD
MTGVAARAERRIRSGFKASLWAGLALALSGCAAVERDPGRISRPGSAVLDQSAAKEAISIYRRNKGLSAVANDPALQKAAQVQADAMAQADRLDHDVAGSFAERTAAIGNGASHAVENVSVGYGTFAAAFSAWRRSDPHNRNLLEPHMTRMGIAAASAPGAKVYWALIMSD